MRCPAASGHTDAGVARVPRWPPTSSTSSSHRGPGVLAPTTTSSRSPRGCPRAALGQVAGPSPAPEPIRPRAPASAMAPSTSTAGTQRARIRTARAAITARPMLATASTAAAEEASACACAPRSCAARPAKYPRLSAAEQQIHARRTFTTGRSTRGGPCCKLRARKTALPRGPSRPYTTARPCS